jgi:hypothetical protein
MEQHALLREAITTFDPRGWDVSPPNSKVGYAQQVIGTAFHDVYHAGQIQTLRAMQKKWEPTDGG